MFQLFHSRDFSLLINLVLCISHIRRFPSTFFFPTFLEFDNFFPTFFHSFYLTTLVEDSGHWIPQDPAGKKRKSHRILQESTGINQKGKQYSDRKFVGFFSGGFQSISCAFRKEPVRNHRKKSENFPVGILLPRSSDFRCLPAGTGP